MGLCDASTFSHDPTRLNTPYQPAKRNPSLKELSLRCPGLQRIPDTGGIALVRDERQDDCQGSTSTVDYIPLNVRPLSVSMCNGGNDFFINNGRLVCSGAGTTWISAMSGSRSSRRHMQMHCYKDVIAMGERLRPGATPRWIHTRAGPVSPSFG
jgi:hypothetical protein